MFSTTWLGSMPTRRYGNTKYNVHASQKCLVSGLSEGGSSTVGMWPELGYKSRPLPTLGANLRSLSIAHHQLFSTLHRSSISHHDVIPVPPPFNQIYPLDIPADLRAGLQATDGLQQQLYCAPHHGCQAVERRLRPSLPLRESSAHRCSHTTTSC